MTCYVCLDTTPPLLSVCSCSDRLLHARCQQRLLSSVPAHMSGRCVVCHAKYTNLSPVTRIVLRTSNCVACVGLTFCALGIFVSISILFANSYLYGNRLSLYMGTALLAVVIAPIALFIAYRRRFAAPVLLMRRYVVSIPPSCDDRWRVQF